MARVIATIQLGAGDLKEIVTQYIRPRIAGGEVVKVEFNYDTVQEQFTGCTVTVDLSADTVEAAG